MTEIVEKSPESKVLSVLCVSHVGEEVLYFVRKHVITNFGWVVKAIMLVLTGVFFYYIVFSYVDASFKEYFTPIIDTLMLAWGFLVVFIVIEDFLRWYYSIFIVTTDRIIDVDFQGISGKRFSETNIENLQDVTFTNSGVMANLFGYGDVFVQTSAEQTEFDMHQVPHPEKIHETIANLIHYKKAGDNKNGQPNS